jgi:hypothetical protein
MIRATLVTTGSPSSFDRRICALALLAASAIQCSPKETCVDKSKPALQQCVQEQDKLQAEIISLKRHLALCKANPGTFKIDPSVLMIDGKPIRARLKEGTLTQDQVIDTMRKNKPVLQACYERAMKKNTSLTHQRITLTVGFSVRPSGSATDISISPNYDSMMIDCMRKAIRRWSFPKFSGQPVVVESPLTLTPRR